MGATRDTLDEECAEIDVPFSASGWSSWLLNGWKRHKTHGFEIGGRNQSRETQIREVENLTPITENAVKGTLITENAVIKREHQLLQTQ